MPRIVLHEPQIPPNTGNVARTCAATCSELHLIEPLGFRIDDRHLRRAGLDYWSAVQLRVHPSEESFLQWRQRAGGRLLAFSSHAQRSYTSCRFAASDWLLFGREDTGLPERLRRRADGLLTIPMPGGTAQPGGIVRSLNLSVAVGVVVFEALRQIRLEGGDDRRDGCTPL
jgi:tRNA (cytidine/uridine-2'-O-)-methyltransferase